jgi:hypothetical protein
VNAWSVQRRVKGGVTLTPGAAITVVWALLLVEATGTVGTLLGNFLKKEVFDFGKLEEQLIVRVDGG